MFWCTRIKQQPISTWDSSRVLLCASVHRTIKRNFPILKDTPLKRYHQTAYLCFCFSLSSLNLSSFILSVELRRSFSFWARFIFRSCSFLCLISLISATFRIRSSRFLHTTNTAVLPFRAECRNTGVLSVNMMCWNTGVLAMTMECRNPGVLSVKMCWNTGVLAMTMECRNTGVLSMTTAYLLCSSALFLLMASSRLILSCSLFSFCSKSCFFCSCMCWKETTNICVLLNPKTKLVH